MGRHLELPLAGASNFRSMSGIPVTGGRIREGMLFRSDAFAGLTDDDHRQVESLGLRTVIDLRRDSERAAEPSKLRLAPGGRTLAHSLVDVVSDGGQSDYFVKLLSSPDDTGALAVVHLLYTRLPHALHGWLQTGFTALAEDEAAPVVVHCAAGKDRTGVFCAVLLHALGAEHEAIVADYILSEGRYPPGRRAVVERLVAQATGIADCSAVSLVLNSARREFIETSLAEIERTWGGLDGYLVSAGITDELRDRLRRIYVTHERP